MAGSINKVILLGRLGSDPEIRVSQDGNKIARLSLATSESWKDKETNEKREKTEWHRIVIFTLKDKSKLENLPIKAEWKNLLLKSFYNNITLH